ncbi:hypothetical protein OO013_04170 [Mangrovivirga sp. M17]|uniref:Uncharacterized protein n=1 Tax=Mangrovivirga halotolerans TaxID=2993936 RepID=A0ABT3RMK0_9BACT|nr:hypothetical protein [Mangrovivirga halotolerans]MCX2743045.1 hypothetical protein [Mangrovivirga halotolerans]
MKSQIFGSALFLIFALMSCQDEGSEITKQSQLEAQLETSVSSYLEAEDNQWIEITEDEYNLLKTKISNASVCGMNDSLFNIAASTSYVSNSGFTRANYMNKAKPHIAPNSYVFAFKYEAGGSTNEGSEGGMYVKISESTNKSGFKSLGNALPAHSGKKTYYFTLKNGSSFRLGDNKGYLGVYNDTDLAHIPYGESYAASGNVANLVFISYTSDKYQALCTTSNPWE